MVGTLYVDVDWGLVVKLALPGKVTRRAYKVFGIYDRFLTNVHFNHTYTRNVLDMDCQTQGRLKLMIGLYISEKSVINSNNLIGAPSYFCW
jgi:hypothetical protein